MSVNRIKLKYHWSLRHFSKIYVKKPGLYFYNPWIDDKRYNRRRLSNSEIFELRDWLSRYINEHLIKSGNARIPEMRANARTIIKGLNKLESEIRP